MLTGTSAPPSQSLILPDDDHNRSLVANVHPRGWVNPVPADRYNLVVIGAGTAGLVSAVGAAGLGAKVAIVERHLMGGDCLNFGCVPSKSVLRAARAAHAIRTASVFGVGTSGAASIDFAAVMERMRRVRAGISHHDSAQRVAGLGVDVFIGEARFVAADAVEVGGGNGTGPGTGAGAGSGERRGGQRLRFSRAVIATGARAASLSIPGFAEAGVLTNETVFSLTELPRRLIVVGAGPIGCELAQAFGRFGSAVTVVSDGARLLPREDADAAALLAERFEREGIAMIFGATIRAAERRGTGKVLLLERKGQNAEIVGDAILVAVGRTPNVEGLGLDTAGVAFDSRGVRVDEHLRTTNPSVYAAGDVCSVYKFTHAADAMARIVLRNALFFGREKAGALVIPWCTYTDPEIAHVGLHAEAAMARGPDVVTLTVPLAQIDRAVLDGEGEGFARVHADRKSGRILGATLIAVHAGEMIAEMSLAITAGLSLASVSKTIHPYPTQAEAWKRLGDAWNRTRLTPLVRGLFERFLRWRR